MKVIDLLNKIANGEIKLGTKFNWHYQWDDIELIFIKRQGALGLYFQREDRLIGLFERFNYQILNDEVEIIEEEKKKSTLNDIRESYGLPRIEEKKIPEKLPFENGKISDNEFLAKYITHNRNAINEIIDYLDYLKSKGDE